MVNKVNHAILQQVKWHLMGLVVLFSGQLSLRGIRFTNFILAIGVSLVL